MLLVISLVLPVCWTSLQLPALLSTTITKNLNSLSILICYLFETQLFFIVLLIFFQYLSPPAFIALLEAKGFKRIVYRFQVYSVAICQCQLDNVHSWPGWSFSIHNSISLFCSSIRMVFWWRVDVENVWLVKLLNPFLTFVFSDSIRSLQVKFLASFWECRLHSS